MLARLVVLVLATMRAVRAREPTAFLEVILFESTPPHDEGYTTYTYDLQGHFSAAGATISAEGDIIQLHPLGLCNNSDEDDLYQYGWVGVVKLEDPALEPQPCLSVFGKAKKAIQRGAIAVIFDVTENPGAIDQLSEGADEPLSHPVVIIHNEEARKLMSIVNRQTMARARIQHSKDPYLPQRSSNEYFDMGIFMAFFILISLICLVLLLKIKWRQRQKQSSLERQATHAISKMETRKFKSLLRKGSSVRDVGAPSCRRCSSAGVRCGWELDGRCSSAGGRREWDLDGVSSSSGGCLCAICLEEFQDGQELRIVPCLHEFHKDCVDPWLLSNRTCPLCMYNIIDCQISKTFSVPGCLPDQSFHGDQSSSIVPLRFPHRTQTESPMHRSKGNIHRNASGATQAPSLTRNSSTNMVSEAWMGSLCQDSSAPCSSSVHHHHHHYYHPGDFQHWSGGQLVAPVHVHASQNHHRLASWRPVSVSSSGYHADVTSCSSSQSSKCRCSIYFSSSSSGDVTDVSNQGIYGSTSTFKSELSSSSRDNVYAGNVASTFDNTEGAGVATNALHCQTKCKTKTTDSCNMNESSSDSSQGFSRYSSDQSLEDVLENALRLQGSYPKGTNLPAQSTLEPHRFCMGSCSARRHLTYASKSIAVESIKKKADVGHYRGARDVAVHQCQVALTTGPGYRSFGSPFQSRSGRSAVPRPVSFQELPTNEQARLGSCTHCQRESPQSIMVYTGRPDGPYISVPLHEADQLFLRGMV
ncbi:E3 ubiquitin-protein ligase ZNRF3-like [Branchiostoma lanceolatum]|uniref:E3 ubiquitin-protein ligase ZNRF3-like n=1 Tax=Branchiostoma lanceolatum TaxID=7740 RepID=UPI00345713DA